MLPEASQEGLHVAVFSKFLTLMVGNNQFPALLPHLPLPSNSSSLFTRSGCWSCSLAQVAGAPSVGQTVLRPERWGRIGLKIRALVDTLQSHPHGPVNWCI